MRALPEGIPPKAGQVPDWSECTPWNLHEATGRHVGSADKQSGLALAPYRVRPPRGSCTLLNKRACPAFLRPLAGRPKGGCQRGERPLARFCILLARTKRMASRGGATPPRRRLEAMPRKTLTKAWGAVAEAAKPSANPPSMRPGAMPRQAHGSAQTLCPKLQGKVQTHRAAPGGGAEENIY